ADHLRRVLRVKPGYRITGFNGKGKGWLAEIIAIDNRFINCRIISTLPPEPVLNIRINIGVAVIKNQRMDWAVEKCSELGADTFIPLQTEYSVVKPGVGKIDRWRSIALASAKQSRRLKLMRVIEPVALTDFLNRNTSEITGIASEITEITFALHNNHDAVSLIKLMKTAQLPISTTILVGPEGGFSDEEIELFTIKDIKTVSLGRRPLRTETAATVILGNLNNLHKWT
ncbi:MAG: 16S rRNA (uracil(1498)-N(3))-methyltransferase, partial [Calditrichaeota bacterium]|nr:16S rRNA (uracil(1498)-N(3))-methyltransferase [Calditrichota bacterium]